MMSRMPAELFLQWQAFYDVEPFGFKANSLLIAAPIARLSQYMGNKQPTLAEFMLTIHKRVKAQGPKVIKAICRGMARVFRKRSE